MPFPEFAMSDYINMDIFEEVDLSDYLDTDTFEDNVPEDAEAKEDPRAVSTDCMSSSIPC